MFSNGLRRLLRRGFGQSSRTKARPTRFRPTVEALEDRCVPTTFTVTNLNNAGENSLRWAIEQANAQADDNHLIDFQAALSGEIILTEALPALEKNINISGPGDSVIAVRRSTAPVVPSFRIFEIPVGKDVDISGLTISHGRAFIDSGGGILNRGTLDLYGVVLHDNKADNSGSGIANYGTLTVENTSIYLNVAEHNGGGIFNVGTAYVQYYSEIFTNQASLNGGGIYNATDATFYIYESQIYGNTAQRDGGGITNYGTLTMQDLGLLELNEAVGAGGANGRGGGLFNGGTATLVGVSIERNAGRKGGGVYVAAGTVTLDKCVVQNNTASVVGPGGSWIAGSTLTTINCTILDQILEDA